MLRACRTLLRPDGWTAFTTIELAPNLSPAARRAARAAAPPAVASRGPYLQLLGRAGFVEVGSRNVTSEYERVAAQSLDEYRRHQDALTEAVGEAFVGDRIATWSGALAVIRRGWLQRSVYWGRRASRATHGRHQRAPVPTL